MLMLPVRCVATVSRFCVAMGRGIFVFAIKLLIGVAGAVAIGVIAYGLLRTFAYPLFH